MGFEVQSLCSQRQVDRTARSPATLRPYRYPFEIPAKSSSEKRLLGLEKPGQFLYNGQVILIVDCDLI
jgi:hypothetical protein